MCSSVTSFLFLPLLPVAANTNDLFVLIPIALLVAVGVVAFALWTMHLAKIQTARASELSRNLDHLRDESRRRLHFLNAISHDLRTPLNGMTLQTHVIEQALESHDEAAISQAVHDMRTSSALAAKILDSLLQYARTEVEHNTLTHVPLKELLSETVDPFRAAAEEKMLGFILHVPDNITLETDRDKLQRILASLLDNAVKFTARGSVNLHAHVRPTDLIQEGSVIIDVTDTGEGMAPEHRKKLFNEFFQVNNPSRDARLGLGLGLVVAKRLTEQLGGQLTCESELHHRSTFRLEVPLKVPPHAIQ